MHILVDGEVREGLVHDGDDRGLFFVKLLRGLKPCRRGTARLLVAVVFLRVLGDELLRAGDRVVLGLGRLDGLCAGDE